MNALTQARDELATEVGHKEAEVAKLKSRLAKLDDLIKDDEPAPARKKPGPKPKAAAVETDKPAEEKPARKKPGPKPKVKVEGEAPKPKGKPGPKPKVKAEGETEKKAVSTRAGEGRRAVARGERPPLKQAMAQVMGTDTCNPAMVYERMEAKGWLPASGDPKTYIGYTLSSSKDVFDRVPAKGRGFYRVKAPAVVTTLTSVTSDSTTAGVSVTIAAPKADANGASKRKPSTDDILKDAGLDLGGPFGG